MDNLLIGRIGLGLFAFGFAFGIVLLVYYFAKNDEGFKLWHVGMAVCFMLFWLVALASASEGFSMFNKNDWKNFKASGFLFKFIVVFTTLSYIIGLLLIGVYAVKSGNLPM